MRNQELETTLEKVSRILTRKYGMRLVCEGSSCKTDGNTIYLPALPEDVPDDLLGAIRGWCDHEVAHALYTQTELGPTFQEEHGKRAFAILNSLEDARIEARLSEDYPGSRLNLEEAFGFVSDNAEKFRGGSDLFRDFASALYLRASGRDDPRWIPPAAYRLADEVQDELSHFPECQSTEEVADVAQAIWEKVRDRVTEEEEEEDSSRRESESDEGQGESPDPEKNPLDGDPGDSEGQPQQGATAEMPGEQGGSPMEALGSLIEEEVRRTEGQDAGKYRVYTRKHDTVEVPEQDPDFDYRAEMDQLKSYTAGLRRKLLQTLLGVQRIRWLRDKTRGKLDPAALHRVASHTSGHVFRQVRQKKGGNTACTLLIDVSASMRGTQIDLCRKMALVFAETLATLGFPTEIIAFSTLDRDLRYEVARKKGVSEDELARQYSRLVPLYHGLFKQFGEPWKQAAPRLGNLRSKCLTPLGESLLFAARRMKSRREKRKVLFCLTDGKPVTGAWDESITFAHACQAVKKVTRAGVEPVAIGIQERSVEDVFPRSAVIHNLEELPRAFLSELCEVLSGR